MHVAREKGIYDEIFFLLIRQCASTILNFPIICEETEKNYSWNFIIFNQKIDFTEI